MRNAGVAIALLTLPTVHLFSEGTTNFPVSRTMEIRYIGANAGIEGRPLTAMECW